MPVAVYPPGIERPVAPERTRQQRMEALQRANDVRSDRAKLKRDLKAGRKSAAAQLLDPPEWLRSAKVIELLLAVPKWGRVKAQKALRDAGVSPSKTIGGLSRRQRVELVRALDGSAGR